MNYNEVIKDIDQLLRTPANFVSIQVAAGADTLAAQFKRVLPCGLQSFLETHYEVAVFITERLTEEKASESGTGPWKQYTEKYGYTSLYDLAFQLTLEFEERNKETDWTVEDWPYELTDYLISKQEEAVL